MWIPISNLWIDDLGLCIAESNQWTTNLDSSNLRFSSSEAIQILKSWWKKNKVFYNASTIKWFVQVWLIPQLLLNELLVTVNSCNSLCSSTCLLERERQKKAEKITQRVTDTKQSISIVSIQNGIFSMTWTDNSALSTYI